MVQKYCCENCQRSQLESQIERYSMRGYVAYLCPTCAYILVNEKKPERFIVLCGRSTDKRANYEMKKVHALLSQFILVGIFFVTIVAAAAIVQLYDEEQLRTVEKQQEYLSFSALNKY